MWEWKVDETRSELDPLAGFGISDVEFLESVTILLIISSNTAATGLRNC
jgi:hypothetical protein